MMEPGRRARHPKRLTGPKHSFLLRVRIGVIMGGSCRAQGSQASSGISVRLALGGGHTRLHVARRVVLHRAAAPTAQSNASAPAEQQA